MNLNFLDYVYKLCGFKYELELSTKPDNALGDPELWKFAEKSLAAALDKFGRPWKENPKDGAFYGPKIDIQLLDALGRSH
jgi:threonyl-tRNA synthetase